MKRFLTISLLLGAAVWASAEGSSFGLGVSGFAFAQSVSQTSSTTGTQSQIEFRIFGVVPVGDTGEFTPFVQPIFISFDDPSKVYTGSNGSTSTQNGLSLGADYTWRVAAVGPFSLKLGPEVSVTFYASPSDFSGTYSYLGGTLSVPVIVDATLGGGWTLRALQTLASLDSYSRTYGPTTTGVTSFSFNGFNINLGAYYSF